MLSSAKQAIINFEESTLRKVGSAVPSQLPGHRRREAELSRWNGHNRKDKRAALQVVADAVNKRNQAMPVAPEPPDEAPPSASGVFGNGVRPATWHTARDMTGGYHGPYDRSGEDHTGIHDQSFRNKGLIAKDAFFGNWQRYEP
jgi:hypothetical protein